MEHEKSLRIGDKALFHRTISDADVYQFAGLTGDFNRIHVDAEYAKTQRFERQIAHGLLSSSYIGTVMGMMLPGSGAIFLDQHVTFLSPAFFGDTITAEVEFMSSLEKQNCYIGEFKGTCTNQRGEVVCTAICHQMMPKNLFAVN